MEPIQAVEALRAFDIDALTAMLHDSGVGSASDAEETTAWVEALRDELVSLVAEIEDPGDVAYTLAINYIELKTRWIKLNTKMNYDAWKHGAADPAHMFRGSAISALIAHVENMLDSSDIDQISSFLAEPVNRAA